MANKMIYASKDLAEALIDIWVEATDDMWPPVSEDVPFDSERDTWMGTTPAMVKRLLEDERV